MPRWDFDDSNSHLGLLFLRAQRIPEYGLFSFWYNFLCRYVFPEMHWSVSSRILSESNDPGHLCYGVVVERIQPDGQDFETWLFFGARQISATPDDVAMLERVTRAAAMEHLTSRAASRRRAWVMTAYGQSCKFWSCDRTDDSGSLVPVYPLGEGRESYSDVRNNQEECYNMFERIRTNKEPSEHEIAGSRPTLNGWTD